ncbi:hypothetical protein Poli38472_005064 [Pythium oligandrum]|uniref:Complex 1 LYR protein domain-containing protein n=1 Tax=Pythium oligandrum TaxID=41045 RepID=A0A8K1FH85_PYTOL|nr:hypothetical protein Poli38472_005064 [Pythium oligandrum]|eukprot:TMW62446.1 hypothetical protein Poli38472_005064 [Pythium oligandrum]
MTHEQNVVRLYRRILKLAQQYPSVKRDAIIQDIKLEFHENKALTDPRMIEDKVQSARQGIRELGMYANLKPAAGAWTVDVGRDAAQGPPSTSSTKVVGDKS